jgi:hypothetical protein
MGYQKECEKAESEKKEREQRKHHAVERPKEAL